MDSIQEEPKENESAPRASRENIKYRIETRASSLSRKQLAVLHRYAYKTRGTTRQKLNLAGAIGLIIPIFMLNAFHYQLGMAWVGNWYFGFIAIIILLGFLVHPYLIWLYLIIVLIAWRHAYKILSTHESLAERRIGELKILANRDASTVLEEGLLEYVVLKRYRQAALALKKAIDLPGGKANLFNKAADVMFENECYNESVRLLDRAEELAESEQLKHRYQKKRRRIAKKIHD